MVKLIFLCQCIDTCIYFFKILIQDLCGQFFHCNAQFIRYGLHGLAGRIGIAVGKVLLLDQPQHVSRTCIGKADALSIL